ncbi:CPCC family cysteine-rich protein [Streptomyces sp. NPDC057696]|uniref:CPCC family cysteine-rich protein n=1 Tax=unclassified Streptomyces TaxID=2593676 RepID=UPI00367B6F9D
MSDSYPCPCCGHRVLGAMPGSYEICPVCFWEDDGVQFRWPTMAAGTSARRPRTSRSTPPGAPST